MNAGGSKGRRAGVKGPKWGEAKTRMGGWLRLWPGKHLDSKPAEKNYLELTEHSAKL